MDSYERMVVNRDTNTADDCQGCPYAGNSCRNQCKHIDTIYNTVIQQMTKNRCNDYRRIK